MTAVLDASPLCYLVLIGEIGLIPRLFSRAMVPQAVIVELAHPDAPEAVRNWAANLPPWILVVDIPDSIPDGTEKLQAGERAAILLAESNHADVVIIDEKAARLIAAQRGLSVTGLLGVLTDAATLGLLDLPQAIDRLRMTSFRCSPALFKSTLESFGK